jgi:dolichol kinase
MPNPNVSSSSASTPDTAAVEEPFPYGAEIKRKALHLAALGVPGLMVLLGKPAALYVLAPGAVLAVAADVLRAYSPSFRGWIQWIFGSLMRAKEWTPVGDGVVINGATGVLVGAALLTWIFPIRLAVPVFVMFMIADAAAALVGRRLGRHPWPGRPHTVEGSLAFVVTGLAVWACFPNVSFLIGVLGVVAAAAVEALPLPLNDNIRVPLVAALVTALAERVLLDVPLSWFL